MLQIEINSSKVDGHLGNMRYTTIELIENNQLKWRIK